MTPNRIHAAAVVMGLCVVGLLTAPAAAQSQRDDGERKRPERLWRLYPLDPEAGQEEGRGRRSPIDVQDSEPPIPSNREQTRGPDGATRERGGAGSSAIPILFALTLLSSGIVLIGLVAWRRRSPARAPRHGLKETPGVAKYRRVEPFAHAPSVRPSTQPPADTDLVRVHLRDGRVVEGEVKQAATHDRPVLLLDVVDVSDANGQKTDPEPPDAFVPLAEVEQIEIIEEGPRDSAPARG
jgi:hypothetical protein